MGWRVRAIRGATTADSNTESAIRQVVTELLDELSTANELDPTEIVYVVFTATPDIDAIFPAAIARQRLGWDLVPLLDVQQMVVPGSLNHCIRVLIQFNTPLTQAEIQHIYLRGARFLRPEWSLSTVGTRPQ
ncbi:chorismate mutase [Synechococcus sp. PCC 7336]|uniref:chorismate mutase n=1 Tax=Synechococcus sp. PCC 7336 TaxID=195250 RepID=UPI00034DD087|nr:chorismate mutase [Synechococcus sp. PCC 7336]